MNSAKLDEAFDIIRKAIADAYERGRADAVSAMMNAVAGNSLPTPQNEIITQTKVVSTENQIALQASAASTERQRAERGSVGRVIQRTLQQKGPSGALVSDIVAARAGELENMIAESSIRGELRRGQRRGEYIEKSGRWYSSHDLFA